MGTGKVFIFNHPLINHKLAILRDKNTYSKKFRELVNEITMLMVYEVTKDLAVSEIEIETPICPTKAQVLSDNNICIVPILRAGLGMVDAMLNIIPTAKVGHIGLYRDHDTLKPVEYYCNLPEVSENTQVILLDPMLATGGSAAAAISFLKKRGLKNIAFVCLISVDEGINRVLSEHPDVDIYCAAKDERLNEKAYIVPGLGDAGDRIFGTN